MRAARTYVTELRASLRSRRGVARNLLFMLIWQGANYLAPLLTFPHLTRTLHPSGFGEYGIYLLVGGWMTIVSDWGTNFTGAKEIAQANARTGEIDEPFWNTVALRLGITALLLLGVIIYLIACDADAKMGSLLMGAWLMAFGNALTVSFCLQGLEQLDAFATAALVGKLLTIPATLLLVRHSDQAWVAIAVQGGGSVVVGLMSIYLLLRSRRLKRIRWSIRGTMAHFSSGLPVLLSVVSHGLYSSTSTMLLGSLSGSAATGIFVCADRLRLAMQGLVSPVSQATFPRISRLVVSDRRAAALLIRRLVVLQFLAMGLLSLIVEGFAPSIIGLIAGPRFSSSVIILRILAPVVVLFAVNNAIGFQALLPFDHQKTFARITIIAAVFNAVIMGVLVYFADAVGAAIGVVATELFLLVCFILALKKTGLASMSKVAEVSTHA